MKGNENTIQSLFPKELKTQWNKTFLKQYQSYLQSKDIYERVQRALGRSKTYVFQNKSTLNANINVNERSTTF